MAANMNDFTKEELEDLYICCGGSIHDDHPLEDWKEALQVKIQYMIDNYCEHNLVTGCFTCSGEPLECVKCRKEFINE